MLVDSLAVISEIHAFNSKFSKLPDEKAQSEAFKEIAKCIKEGFPAPEDQYYHAKSITNKIVKRALYHQLEISPFIKTIKEKNKELTDALVDLIPSKDSEEFLKSFKTYYPHIRRELAEAILTLPKKKRTLQELTSEIMSCALCPFSKRKEAAEHIKELMGINSLEIDGYSDFSKLFKFLSSLPSTRWQDIVNSIKDVNVDLIAKYPSEEEKLEVLYQGYALLFSSGNAIDSYNIGKILQRLHPVAKQDRPKLVRALSQIIGGIGLGEVESLIKYFNRLPPDEEFPEVVVSSKLLFDETMQGSDRFVMINALIPAPFGQRKDIAEIVNQIALNLGRKLHSAEKANLVDAMIPVNQKKRKAIATAILELDQHMRGFKRELSGPDLARLIRALNLVPVDDMENIMSIVWKTITAKTYVYEIDDLIRALLECPKDKRESPEIIKELKIKWLGIRINSGEEFF